MNAAVHQGQKTYDTLIARVAELAAAHANTSSEHDVIARARHMIPDSVSDMRVQDVMHVHEYLQWCTVHLPADPRMPAYAYDGGDRIMSVTRYLLRHIATELARVYV